MINLFEEYRPLIQSLENEEIFFVEIGSFSYYIPLNSIIQRIINHQLIFQHYLLSFL